MEEIPIEIPAGLDKEETRVFALGASEGVLAMLRIAVGDDGINVHTTGWDESALPESGTLLI